MKLIISFLTILLLLPIFPQVYEATSTSESRVVQALQEETRVNVLFSNKVDAQLLEKYEAEIIYTYDAINAVTIQLPPEYIEKLKKEENVESVEEDQLVQLQSQTANWGYSRLEIANRVPSNLSGKGVKIAIIDSGIDTNHPDLKVAGGICVLDLVTSPNGCSNSYEDDNGHGTHVAGIIGAQDNDIGVVGIAPNASLYAVKALDDAGFGTTSSIMAALDWSIKQGIDVVNLSLTTPNNDPTLREMIRKVYNSGILVIAAAGNEDHVTGNEENVLYPAKYSQVIAVSALGKDNKLLSTSSVGKEVELTAPGGNIFSTVPIEFDTYGSKDGYGSMSGTSMAAPFVTAMVALYMEKYPALTHEEIRQLLQKNALDLGEAGRDSKFGYGLIQLDKEDVSIPAVSTTVQADGTITISVDSLPAGTNQYNLYRFDQKIMSNKSSSTVEDYASQGSVLYKVIPLSNGVERTKQASVFRVDVKSPKLADMNNRYWFSRNVMYLHRENIMKGYNNGEIRPYQQITRAEALVLLVNAIGLEPDPTYNTFRDVSSSSFAAGHVGIALKNGIISGFADGTFRGNQAVTRAEMSIMIANAFQLPTASTTASFSDLNSKVTGYDAIQRVVASKIAQGYADGSFKPYAKMNRSTYAVFISRAINDQLK